MKYQSYLLLLLFQLFHCQESDYYINITKKILKLSSLPFHSISSLLDDSVILDSDLKWIDVYENSGSCLYARCTKDPDSCFNIKNYNEVTEDEMVEVSEIEQRFLSDDDEDIEEEAKYLLLADICEENQFCDINLNFNGICTNHTENYVEREALVVGQTCSDDMYWKVCAYGSMKCINERCAPVSEEMVCHSSIDCEYNQYCDNKGKCVPVIAAGGKCTEQEQCGRTGACYYEYLSDVEGQCHAYFETPKEVFVGTYIGHDHLFRNRSNFAVLPQMNLLCGSGFSNEEGYCDVPKRTSLNKGKQCYQDRDCKTNIPGSVAKCRCGINPWGMKVCDITEGDEEWLQALESFKKYYYLTAKCSAGFKWKECGNSKAYYRMKCDGLRARFYPWLVNNEELEECMLNMTQSMPLFKELVEACEIAFDVKSVALGIFAIIATVLLII